MNFTITEQLGGFVFGWWQNDRYNVERPRRGRRPPVGIATRNDNLYEVGGGLTWQFAPKWSLNPEVLYIRDQSNILASELQLDRGLGHAAQGLLASGSTRWNVGRSESLEG